MIDEIVKASDSKDDFMARIARRMQRKEVPFSSSSSHLGTLWNKPNTQKLKAIWKMSFKNAKYMFFCCDAQKIFKMPLNLKQIFAFFVKPVYIKYKKTA